MPRPGIVLTSVPPIVDGFLAYCWYLADVADVLDPDDRRTKVFEGIHQTLAWQQLPTTIQERWEALRSVFRSYESTDPIKRRRWARSGARLSANCSVGIGRRQRHDCSAIFDLGRADRPDHRP